MLINFSRAGEEPYILFANRHLIRRVNLEGVEPEILINESGNAIAMDFDIRCNFLREGGEKGGGGGMRAWELEIECSNKCMYVKRKESIIYKLLSIA